jgi:hypothetical protein
LVAGDSASPVADEAGHYEFVSDPDSGEVKTVWVPEGNDPQGFAPGGQMATRNFDIKCYARSYTALGYRSSANREIMVQQDYQAIESIQFDFPKDVLLNRQTFVTNIRSHKNLPDYLWLHEDSGQPIVWECQGVSPVHDPFGKHIRNTTVLKKAEVQ